MKKEFLNIVNKFEGWKTGLKQLHWDAINLSQHRLADDIASDIADMQDTISEIEQSIENKNFSLNDLKPVKYNCKDLFKFLTDVIRDVTSFYKSEVLKGDKYIGLRSEIESFLSKCQRYVYLNKFCLNEDKKREIKNMLKETKSKKLNELNQSDLVSIVKEAVNIVLNENNGSGIEIDPENKGKFTATKKKTGKSTEELTHSKNPLTRKRAIFAQNVKKWNHKKN